MESFLFHLTHVIHRSVKRAEGKLSVLVKNVSSFRSILRYRHRSRIEIPIPLSKRLSRRNMRVSAKEHVSRLQPWRVLQRILVSVRCENAKPVREHVGIVRKKRKIKHHLIHLRVAVAAHTDYLIGHRIQKRDHALGRVSRGEIVARTVI